MDFPRIRSEAFGRAPDGHGQWKSCLGCFHLVSGTVWNSLLFIFDNFFFNTYAYIWLFLILGQELLAGSYAPSQLDLDLRETEILKLKGYISQSVVLRRSIRFREFYSIHYIFSGLLKSPFPHSKNVKILDFSNFGQKPL